MLNIRRQQQVASNWCQSAVSIERWARVEYFVSCWHMNRSEPEDMWDAAPGRSVAVRTTPARMRRSLEVDTEHDVYLGTVRYVDRTVDGVDAHINMVVATVKDLRFRFEREVRTLVPRFCTSEDDVVRVERDGPFHRDVSVDLVSLIESVVVRSDDLTRVAAVHQLLTGNDLSDVRVYRSGHLTEKPSRCA